MFGFLRLFLASMVVLFHSGFHSENAPFGIQIGIPAVVIFYMISGYAMSGLYSSRFKTAINAHHFYIERCIRILPQYFLFLIITFLVLFYFELWFSDYPKKELNLKDIISNILLIPLALKFYFPSLMDFAWVGHAVSLANEMIFYLFVPLIISYKSILNSLTAISITVFSLSTQNIIQLDAYSYFNLPGPLIFCIVGHLIYQKKWPGLMMVTTLMMFNQTMLLLNGKMESGFNLDLYIGFYTGLVLIFFLGSKKTNKIDTFFGSASYGCFLGHLPLLVAFKHYEIFKEHLLYFSMLMLTTSVLIGFMSYFLIEKPARKHLTFWWRRKTDSGQAAITKAYIDAPS